MDLFTSDYTEGCHPRILEALGRTNLEQTSGYGTDPPLRPGRSAHPPGL